MCQQLFSFFLVYIIKICDILHRSMSKCLPPIRKQTAAHILFSRGILEHKFPLRFLSHHPICESHCQGYHSPSQAFTAPRAIMCITTTSVGGWGVSPHFSASVNVSNVHCHLDTFTAAHCEAATLTRACGELEEVV